MPFPDDTDIERIARGLLDRTLPKSAWTHAGHFAAALWLCRHRPDLTAPGAIRRLISRYNAASGTPNTDVGGYHHTITLVSMAAAASHLAAAPPEMPLHMLLASLLESPCGRSDWLLAYWRSDRLFSLAARRSWLAPDLRPLPFPVPPHHLMEAGPA